MKKRILSVLLALVMALSMSLMTAMPAMADTWTPTTALVSGERATVLYDSTSSTYHMWYVLNKVAYHTSSTDPAGIFPVGTAVTGLPPANPPTLPDNCNCPFVMKEAGVYYMPNYNVDEMSFYIYTSTDGAAWTVAGKIYDKTGHDDWVKMDNPKLLKDANNTYKLYFQVKSTAAGNPYYIYLATSSLTTLAAIATTGDTIDFTLVGTTPVLSPGTTPTTDWDGWRVMQPMVVKDGSNYYMWYLGYSNAAPTGKIGAAFSSDGVNWTKVPGNPVLTGDVWKPSVLKVGSTYHMWYMKGTGIAHISAQAPFGVEAGSVGLTATPPTEIIGIFVTPAEVNFGAIQSGAIVPGVPLTVANTGNAFVSVSAEMKTDTLYDSTYFYTKALKLHGVFSDTQATATVLGKWTAANLGLASIAVGGLRSVTTRLECPAYIRPGITYTGTILFVATSAGE